jgi:hypothetical protein
MLLPLWMGLSLSLSVRYDVGTADWASKEEGIGWVVQPRGVIARAARLAGHPRTRLPHLLCRPLRLAPPHMINISTDHTYIIAAVHPRRHTQEIKARLHAVPVCVPVNALHGGVRGARQ